jgi:uncharacterized membrane protein YvbJ
MEKNICPGCGAKVTALHGFCPGCGRKLEWTEDEKRKAVRQDKVKTGLARFSVSQLASLAIVDIVVPLVIALWLWKGGGIEFKTAYGLSFLVTTFIFSGIWGLFL